ncbi:TetR/AcrR family transcriptional regulator [Streptomyces sp. NBC_00038]|uniref:TetR/AcrR family transcriptional regulator n=1 Tax=Streptomyces sp. NBC_00038 TaxID=2903615 RepID=UPI0022559701|nr:TetR/AcrR family transcriptional regulator [Streptomyces sp. NBC_00038]MCX5554430.1 TetR/AcrR family transcriptional regulator [Streptomyces sp. NBC_00038]
MAAHSASGEAGGSGGTRTPRPRRDRERNRRKLLVAAREVFREHGLKATLDDVAHHAGLGVGTAYRHFANKQALIDELVDDMFARVEEATREGAEDADAWRGLTVSLERVAELQALDRGLREVVLHSDRAVPAGLRHQEQIRRNVDLVVERAKEQGALRADAEPWDLVVIQQMLAAVTERSGQSDLWRRYLRLLLDGLRAGPERTEPLPGEDSGKHFDLRRANGIDPPSPDSDTSGSPRD